MRETATVHVSLGADSYDVDSYDVLIGPDLLKQSGTRVASILARSRTVIVTDTNVARHHLPTLQASLDGQGIAHATVTLEAGEQTKAFSQLELLLDQLLDHGIERADTIIALGGGVIGDLTGFAASILHRGIGFIQIPTTLLAQIDSSVGGKTGIDTKYGKNLVGAFHQPRIVLADTGVLDTLPERELRAGYAEMAKYGLLGNVEFFDWLENNGHGVITGDQVVRRHAVHESCRTKADVVAEDTRDRGKRNLLNLGHTFGHALEAATGYGTQLLHGEAVALGMVMAFEFSARHGLCHVNDTKRVRHHLANIGLPIDARAIGFSGADAHRLIAYMRQDKKVADGRVTLVLVRGIGQAFLSRDFSFDQIEAFLADHLS